MDQETLRWLVGTVIALACLLAGAAGAWFGWLQYQAYTSRPSGGSTASPRPQASELAGSATRPGSERDDETQIEPICLLSANLCPVRSK
jgi:hypothetical protein